MIVVGDRTLHARIRKFFGIVIDNELNKRWPVEHGTAA